MKCKKYLSEYKYSLLITIGIFCLMLFIPALSHAANTSSQSSSLSKDPLYLVLRDNQQMHTLWKRLMEIINGFIVLIMITVAFAEILRININSYGIKKVLPTLIFAVIAANFSWILVRTIVDFANVIMTVFGTHEGIINPLKNFSTHINITFDGDAQVDPDQLGGGGTVGPLAAVFQILFLWIAGIAMYILAFLMFIRNWVIYFLAIVSGVAFMAMALPQTKTYFNKWWTMLLQWTFMPVASVAILWIGGTILKTLNDTSFMAFVFALVCVFAAITTPFKMGGKIMDSFYKYTGAQAATKWAGNNAKKYYGGKAKNILDRQWANWRQKGLDLQRNGKTPFAKWMGRNWFGNGMDKVEADAAHNQARLKGVKEGVQARYYYGKGKKFQMEREYTKAREGEIGEFETYMIKDILADGKQNPDDPYYQKLVKFRTGSSVAKETMDRTNAAYQGLLDEGTKNLLNKNEQDKLSDSEFSKRYGMSKEKANELVGELAAFATVAEEYSNTATKAKSDLTKKPNRERVAIHNVVDLKEMVDNFDKIFGTHLDDFERIIQLNGEQQVEALREFAANNNMLDKDGNVLKSVSNALRQWSMIEKTARGMNFITESERMYDPETLRKIKSSTSLNYNEKIEQLKAQKMILMSDSGDVSYVDPRIADLIDVQPDGKTIHLKGMSPLVANRARVKFDMDRMEKTSEWRQQYELESMIAALDKDGPGLPTEDITFEHLKAAHFGLVNKDLKSGDVANAAVVLRNVQTGIGDRVKGYAAAKGYLTFLKDAGDNAAILERTGKIYTQISERSLDSGQFNNLTRTWSELAEKARTADSSLPTVSSYHDLSAMSDEVRGKIISTLEGMKDDNQVKTLIERMTEDTASALKGTTVQADRFTMSGVLSGALGRFGDINNG